MFLPKFIENFTYAFRNLHLNISYNYKWDESQVTFQIQLIKCQNYMFFIKNTKCQQRGQVLLVQREASLGHGASFK